MSTPARRVAAGAADPGNPGGTDSLDVPGEPLARLLAGPVDAAARGLLGCELRAGTVAVRLTEVEAYGGVGTDPASHAYRGLTARNQVMFGPAGLAYVYFVFGMHWCLNVVCGQEGHAAAVLLRAGEVVAGLDVARARRGGTLAQRELARGPARLAVVLGVDGAANGTSLLDGTGPITLCRLTDDARLTETSRPLVIESGPRVGVAAEADRPWRYWLAAEPTVSGYRRHPAHRPSAVPKAISSTPPVPELSEGGPE